MVAAVHDKSKEGAPWEGSWKQDVTQKEFLDHFVGWEEEFQALIRVRSPLCLQQHHVARTLHQCIRQPTRWAVHNMNHLDVFAKGRVILIGDSVGST